MSDARHYQLTYYVVEISIHKTQGNMSGTTATYERTRKTYIRLQFNVKSSNKALYDLRNAKYMSLQLYPFFLMCNAPKISLAIGFLLFPIISMCEKRSSRPQELQCAGKCALSVFLTITRCHRAQRFTHFIAVFQRPAQQEVHL